MEIWKEEKDSFFKAGTDGLKRWQKTYVKMENATVFVCVQGEAEIEINRRMNRLSQGMQAVLFPGSIICIACASDDFQIAFVDFSNNILRDVTVRFDSSFKFYFWEHPVSSISEDNQKDFLTQTDFLNRLYLNQAHSYRMQIARNYIQSILLDIYDDRQRRLAAKPSNSMNRQEELFCRFMELVHKHCTEQRELPFYADRLCITPRRLSTIAHKVSGLTTKQLIDEQVILESKVLLKSTTLSVKEIADRLNFADQSFFGKYFRRHVGMTPNEFREKGWHPGVELTDKSELLIIRMQKAWNDGEDAYATYQLKKLEYMQATGR